MKRLCAQCQKRPAGHTRVTTHTGSTRTAVRDKDHELCGQCFKSLRDSVNAQRLRAWRAP